MFLPFLIKFEKGFLHNYVTASITINIFLYFFDLINIFFSLFVTLPVTGMRYTDKNRLGR